MGTNYAQIDLNVDLGTVHVDGVATPTLKFSDAKHHASLFSSRALHFVPMGAHFVYMGAM